MTGLVSAALFALSLVASAVLPPDPGHGAAPPWSSPHSSPGTAALWPLEPRTEVVRPFRPPAQDWEAGHRGVDLAGHPGQTIRAPLPGTVAFAGTIAGRGVVVLDHGHRRTTYEPVDAAAQIGESVPAGAVIGTLQGGLGHCAPWVCLHWGLIAGTQYQDPLGLVRPGPVRLLPMLPGLLRPADAPGGRHFAVAHW